MEKVQVTRKALMAVLTKNRDKHIEEYKEALTGYYIQAKKDFTERLALIENGEEFTTYFDLHKPANHVKEYNDVLDMLGITSSEKIDSYQIFNILGENVGSNNSNAISNEISVSYLKAGIYFLTVFSGQSNSVTKFIKQ
jgi:hypothetical protein